MIFVFKSKKMITAIMCLTVPESDKKIKQNAPDK